MRSLRGFTLIEILVVLVIVAIMTGVVLARLDASDGRKLKLISEQMAVLLEAGRDEAVTRGLRVAISSDGEGYQFWVADEDRNDWRALTGSDILISRRLPENVIWHDQTVNGRERPLGERIVFFPSGLVEPFAIDMRLGMARVVIVADVMGRVVIGDVVTE